MIVRFAWASALTLMMLVPATAQEVRSLPGAVLRGLDKVAGASMDITVQSGESVAFGRLTISLDDCRQTGGNPADDSYAHLTIMDPHAPEGPVYSGWMIASSPALSALDHSRYDVWLLRCSSS